MIVVELMESAAAACKRCRQPDLANDCKQKLGRQNLKPSVHGNEPEKVAAIELNTGILEIVAL